MSKHRNRFTLARNDQQPQVDTPPVETKDNERVPPAVVSKVLGLRDVERQDKIINEKEASGYIHYESIQTYGGEMILRFRRKNAN